MAGCPEKMEECAKKCNRPVFPQMKELFPSQREKKKKIQEISIRKAKIAENQKSEWAM